jgi:pimeloyl-ACP methyl ester carboxylesterase
MGISRVRGPAGDLAFEDGGPSQPASSVLPIVLLHSLAGSIAQWSAQLSHLRVTRRTVAIDLRGHGRSSAPSDRNYALAAMAADVAAIVDALNIGKFVLVGHSLGGGVALTYAGLHPERVAGLLLLDPIGDGTQLPAAEVSSFLDGITTNYDRTVPAYWSQIAGPDAAVRERLLADLQATPRETVIAGFQEAMRFEPRPALRRYRGPMLSVVTPSNDQPFSLHRVGNGFPHRIVQGTGHWIQLDKPDEVNQIIDEFITGLEQA